PARCLAASDAGSPPAGHRSRARQSDDDAAAKAAPRGPGLGPHGGTRPPARAPLVIEAVLGSPTTTRPPKPPNAALILFPTMARVLRYSESPPGGFQDPRC